MYTCICIQLDCVKITFSRTKEFDQALHANQSSCYLLGGHWSLGTRRWTRKCHGFQQTYSLSDLSNLDPTTRVAKLQDSCSSEPPLDLRFSGSVAKPQYMGTYKWRRYNYYGIPVYQKCGYYVPFFFYESQRCQLLDHQYEKML